MTDGREHGTIEHASDVTLLYTDRDGRRWELRPQGEIQLKLVRPALDYEDELRLLMRPYEHALAPPTPHLETSPLHRYTLREVKP